MTRMLVIPAAGRGSRLGAPVPKLLVQVAGRPMIEHLLGLYASTVDRVVVVVSPAARPLVEEFLRERHPGAVVAVQHRPTGMLDAVLTPSDIVREFRPDRIWVTWGDQVAIRPETVDKLVAAESGPDHVDLAFPTSRRSQPYIHFPRDGRGRIAGLLEKREGDAMPPAGESDMGLFSLSRTAYLERLPAFASTPQRVGRTGERNFLPFIPWLAATGRVVTFPGVDPVEAIGINTPEDLHRVEEHLRARAAGRPESGPG